MFVVIPLTIVKVVATHLSQQDERLSHVGSSSTSTAACGVEMVFERAELHPRGAVGEGVVDALLIEVADVVGGGPGHGEVDAGGGGVGVVGVEVRGRGRQAQVVADEIDHKLAVIAPAYRTTHALLVGALADCPEVTGEALPDEVPRVSEGVAKTVDGLVGLAATATRTGSRRMPRSPREDQEGHEKDCLDQNLRESHDHRCS